MLNEGETNKACSSFSLETGREERLYYTPRRMTEL